MADAWQNRWSTDGVRRSARRNSIEFASAGSLHEDWVAVASARDGKELHTDVHHFRMNLQFATAQAPLPPISARFGFHRVSRAGVMTYRCPGVTNLKATVSGGADA